MTNHLRVKHIDKVLLQLSANVGIHWKFVWFWQPKFEHEFIIGLLSLYALTISQFKSVLAHEVGHIQQKDTLLLLYINNSLLSLQGWTVGTWSLFANSLLTPMLGWLIGLVSFPLHLILLYYLRLLIWISRWALRRQEYTADRVAAQAYGKSSLQQALISLGSVGIGFEEYLPIIIQNIENNFDRHDFYHQFVNYWDNSSVTERQRACAKAVASLNSVYDTHPSYQDRYRALKQVNNVSNIESDDRLSGFLLPNASELGRDLTIQILQHKNLRV